MSPQPQQYPLVSVVQFLVPVPIFTHLNLDILDHLFSASLRILGALACGKWEYMHLFKQPWGRGQGHKSQSCLPILIPTFLLRISHCLYWLLFYCLIPFPASTPKDLLSPSEEVIAFLSSVLNSFLYCHSFHPRFCLSWEAHFFQPPCHTSGATVGEG